MLMRLREDKSSYKVIGLAKRYEELDDEPIIRRRKNTKKWCGGKVGKEHDWEVKIPKNCSMFIGIRYPICRQCGKHDMLHTEYQCHTCGTWDEHPHFGNNHGVV